MNSELVLYLGRRVLETALIMSSPILVVALVVGFATAIFQAVTSIRDMTLGIVLKLACVGFAIMIFGGWMMETAVVFTTEIFNHMQMVAQ